MAIPKTRFRFRLNKSGARLTVYGWAYNRTWALTWSGAKIRR